MLGLQHRLADRLVYSKVKDQLGGRLRVGISGGAPLAKEIAEFFHSLDLLIVEGYGLTECTTAATVNQPSKFRFGTVGTALPNVELKIAEDGEVLIKTPTLFAGYYKDAEATSEVLPGDGWLRTGDIGHIDADGFLTITDRKKDIIVTAGGKNVAPQNLENELKASRFVSQALVVGDKRPYCVALITLDEPELVKWAHAHGLNGELSPDAVAGRARAGARAGHRRPRQRRALALRADQEVRAPPARLHDGRRRGDADAQAQAARLPGALRGRDRSSLRALVHAHDASLNRVTFSATLHCLTGCAIGEVLGMIIGTALGWGDVATIALAIVLAFFFGYSFTVVPLLRSGMALGAAAGSRSWPTRSRSR